MEESKGATILAMTGKEVEVVRAATSQEAASRQSCELIIGWFMEKLTSMLVVVNSWQRGLLKLVQNPGFNENVLFLSKVSLCSFHFLALFRIPFLPSPSSGSDLGLRPNGMMFSVSTVPTGLFTATSTVEGNRRKAASS